MKLQELHQELKKNMDLMNELIRKSGYEEYEEVDVDMIEDYGSLNPDERQLCKACCRFIEKLAVIKENMEYYERSIDKEGTLHWNPRTERYEFAGIELHCGYGFEILVYDDFTESYTWEYTTIEMDRSREDNPNKEGYYLTAHSKLAIEGLQARHRA